MFLFRTVTIDTIQIISAARNMTFPKRHTTMLKLKPQFWALSQPSARRSRRKGQSKSEKCGETDKICPDKGLLALDHSLSIFPFQRTFTLKFEYRTFKALS